MAPHLIEILGRVGEPLAVAGLPLAACALAFGALAWLTKGRQGALGQYAHPFKTWLALRPGRASLSPEA